LIAKRAALGKMTVYYSERWFKPNVGVFRLLSLSYLKMAWRFVELLRTGKWLTFYPVGIHAAEDMARLCGLFAGDLRCLFRAPKLDFERRPGGRIYIREQGTGNREQDKKYCLDKMRMWGYFVEASRQSSVVGHQCQSQLATNDQQPTTNPPLTTNDYPLTTVKVLWVGRFLNWKRVDTIIRAVGELATNSISDNLHSPTRNSNSNSPTPPLTHSQLSLDIYGTGPEETRLKKLAAKYDDVIKFYPPVPIDEVRRLMREHDIYVLASNAYEGWGAVVSEALEEGMKVIGTYEAGSSATILPKECLFHAGDWKGLFKLLKADVSTVGIGSWSAENAVEVIDA
jgi:glycosyltransferase involved in cell wall biosynthesis